VVLAASVTSASARTQTGLATCYARRLTHHKTSSGKRYNPNALTAAHHTIPNGTHVKVTDLENGRSVVVLIDDRLPRHPGRGIIIDLSHSACTQLEFGKERVAKVKLEVVGAESAQH
jgi:rare lipoprotein A